MPMAVAGVARGGSRDFRNRNDAEPSRRLVTFASRLLTPVTPMTPTLSILTPTLASRRDWLAKLRDCLQPQLCPAVEWLCLEDDGEQSTGAKRNALVAQAAGEWLVHIDDDDTVAPDYVARVVAALAESPDCVGYMSQRYLNGRKTDLCQYALGNPVQGQRRLPGGGWLLLRCIYHVSPVRASIARQFKFPDLDSGEDTAWAAAIAPSLRTTVFIAAVCYHYYQRSHKRGDRNHGMRALGLIR